MKRIFTGLSFIAVCLFSFGIQAQTLSSIKNPGSVLNSTTTTGTYSWTINSSQADCNLPQGFTFAFSKGIVLSNFGFSVPVTATIVGITSDITYASTVTSIPSWTANPRDTNVVLVLNGVETGSNHAVGILGSSTLTTPGNGRTKHYGTPTDLWGVNNITQADVNNNEFGLAIYMAHYPYKNESSCIYLNNSYSLTPDPTPIVTVYYLISTTGVIESQTSAAKIYTYGHNIHFTNTISHNGDFLVYDLLGNKVYETKVEAGTEEVSLEHLNTGIYIYQLRTGDKVLCQRIKLD